MAFGIFGGAGVQDALPLGHVANFVTRWAQKDVVFRVAELNAVDDTRRVSVPVGVVVVRSVVRASVPWVRAELKGGPEGLTLFFQRIKEVKAGEPIRTGAKAGNSGNERVVGVDSNWRQIHVVFIPIFLVDKESVAFHKIICNIITCSGDLLLKLLRETDLEGRVWRIKRHKYGTEEGMM